MPTRHGRSKAKRAAPSTEHYLDPELVQDLQNRLRRLEGHIRGIQRMLADQAACEDLLIQTSAVRAALNQINIKILEGHMQTCVMECVEEGEGPAALDKLRGALAQVLKNA
jgi:DNA-binding FrmR family transcriptional regulator